MNSPFYFYLYLFCFCFLSKKSLGQPQERAANLTGVRLGLYYSVTRAKVAVLISGLSKLDTEVRVITCALSVLSIWHSGTPVCAK